MRLFPFANVLPERCAPGRVIVSIKQRAQIDVAHEGIAFRYPPEDPKCDHPKRNSDHDCQELHASEDEDGRDQAAKEN